MHATVQCMQCSMLIRVYRVLLNVCIEAIQCIQNSSWVKRCSIVKSTATWVLPVSQDSLSILLYVENYGVVGLCTLHL